jgi:hypothetical protein
MTGFLRDFDFGGFWHRTTKTPRLMDPLLYCIRDIARRFFLGFSVRSATWQVSTWARKRPPSVAGRFEITVG